MYKSSIKIAIITACGKKKENKPKEAGLLYKSSRIRHLYKKSQELDIPLYILSAKYGLIHSDEIIEPYDQIMTEEKAEKLLPQVKEVLKNFDVVIFYRGGARKEYVELIEKASKKANVKVIIFGYGNMGEISKLNDIVVNMYGRNPAQINSRCTSRPWKKESITK